ncbi:MAG: SDR family oxidoreductase [Microcoleus sp. PH2017_29_MFU_D_A]|jgi:NAD(P)-dependent dehydrogenase (short-subunit alcohol dehydrogenase family)|uniref:SDR family oxidoreductase n=1 Tax=unclassified Microcoleus TaxID=2642155 RepID=UPI001D3591D4|nr:MULTISPECIES: SDR family oxidoreductase [unclassified Microcoleus]MCC3421484.1 SDR family oxidoreductase [Microcoleus sp. PH2017_07_MST_O_A]MCC3431352.1 SDR family oxidoreductase [Microcoleus sp. PH2017_04_SCI_O_A]MCC3469397.1 SDR family oxidoreductase [Microcoleus sp. PH2017_06_SFM_O_A]MCC3506984.1 SDR family oxidoreductase [Microcoleus sp. PH2017_19_SFW_U_A]MCC3513205.1 SDR family oxidoreductase [Microcoleus sp. PH2017_17_BER_D_A]TAE62393.1 MAG: SDR family NAD(P)-dependent oxidoreductase
MDVTNSIALVTGANGGIGRYYVEALRTAGVSRIYAGARNLNSLTNIVAIDPERIIPISLDITDEQSVTTAAATYRDVTLLINNAGIGLLKGFISATDFSSARAEMEVNYFGTLAMCRAFAPVLKDNGGGAIVNMLSILGKVNFPMNASYCASKAAAILMTQGVRAELAAQGTLVVGVMPGTVDTEVSRNFPPPKVSPKVVAQEALQAVIDEVEDVYPGEQAKEMAAQLLKDPKALEKMMATMLPS